MTLEGLAANISLVNHNANADLSREITGVYIGDLLSWVMGRAMPGCIWITIMSNMNVAAVASLANVSCVLLAEDVQPDQALLDKAHKENIALFSSKLSAYQLATSIAKLMP